MSIHEETRKMRLAELQDKESLTMDERQEMFDIRVELGEIKPTCSSKEECLSCGA